MTKIPIAILMIALSGCSYFQPEEEVYYVRETMTSHCFKVWGAKKEIRYEWIDCRSIPRKADVRDVQEFEIGGEDDDSGND